MTSHGMRLHGVCLVVAAALAGLLCAGGPVGAPAATNLLFINPSTSTPLDSLFTVDVVRNAGDAVQGTVEAVEVPNITGTETIGVHRVIQTVVDGKPRTGEVYNYSAHFDDYQVIVSANPLVLPGQPVVAVNTQRARDLLIAGVNAIRR